jgi:tRNA nucleotidyltransferase (CCA-adding enzyme)
MMSAADSLLRAMRSVAEQCSGCQALYLVGGAVRDHLLGAEPEQLRDLDFVVVGDAEALGRALVQRCGGEVQDHERFLTTTWRSPLWPSAVDIVTARRESYSQPGALPDVQRGELEDDLARRCFTLNSMAARVWPGELWQLVDPLGCLPDLQQRLLRIHHPNSFLDDPTRMLRLARFAVRLGLGVHEDTAAALAAALAGDALATVSGDRLWAEWELLCQEPEPEAVVAWMHECGLAAALSLPAEDSGLATLRRGRLAAQDGRPWQPLQALAALCLGTDSSACAQRFGLDGARAARLAGLAALPGRLAGPLQGCDGDDQLEELLGSLDAKARAFLVAAEPPCCALTLHYEEHVEPLPPLLRGDELLAAGMPQGPALGEALREVRAAQLRGEVENSTEALSLLGLGDAD